MAPNTTAGLTLVVTPSEYEAVSTPPAHAPLTPIVLAATSGVTGFVDATPEYRATAITELVAIDDRVAVTVPVVAVPCADQSSVPV
jgi:hypothetical protein